MASKVRFLRILGAVAVTALALAGCGPQKKPVQQETVAAEALPPGCLLGDEVSFGGPIALVDQSGRAVSETDFQESATLIYFGYTFCPDICPLSLQMEKQALAALGEQGQVIQPVLITLDPARDTPDKLSAYVKSEGFPEGLVGLTGTEAEVAAAAKAFKVAWQKEADPKSAGQYTIAHTSFFYLMNEDWELAALFPSKFTPVQAAACLRAGLKRSESPS
jgi:protein SCO1/2